MEKRNERRAGIPKCEDIDVRDDTHIESDLHSEGQCCHEQQGDSYEDIHTGRDLHCEGAPEEHVHDHGSHVCTHHHHVNVEDTSGSRLLMTLGLNLIIPIVQIIGGMAAHSMALISDAAHNFSDFTAVLVAYVANRIGKRGASIHNTFGYRRTEILAALINVGLLLGAAAFIIFEAVHRLHHPETVFGQLVVIIAGVGVLGNGFSAWLLHRDAKHNLNVRGAFLHMLGDLLTSVVVVINGIVIMYKPWYWLDPALSLFIALFIAKNCWTIVKEAVSILMNATPNGLDIYRIKNFLERIPEIRGVHYLHAWNVCSKSIAFSCHVVVPDQNLSKIDALACKIRELLLHHFGIDHPVLQFETSPCGEGSVLCEMACTNPVSSFASPGSPERSDSPPERLESPHHSRRFFKRPLVVWSHILLGIIFVVASVGKIYRPSAFADLFTTIKFFRILSSILPPFSCPGWN